MPRGITFAALAVLIADDVEVDQISVRQSLEIWLSQFDYIVDARTGTKFVREEKV